jgi:hypothetical protein
MQVFKFVFLLFLSFVFSSNATAQTDSTDSDNDGESFSLWVKPSSDEKSRLGIKMGMQITGISGNAIPNARPMFGLLGGGYGRINFKGGWSLQQEVQVSFRGSNYQSEANGIKSLRLLYIDAPLYLMKQLKRNSPHKLGVGMQYAHQISAAMYIDSKAFPTGVSPSLDRNDWMPSLAYQYQLDYFAIQVAGKYGLRNINLGNPWPENAKPLNNNEKLHNFAFEVNLIF